MLVDKIVLWLFPLLPITFMYTIGGLPLGYLVYGPLFIAQLLIHKKYVFDHYLKYLFGAYFCVLVIQAAFSISDIETVVHIIIGSIFWLLAYICFTNYIRLEDLLRPYIILSVIYMLGLFYQVIQLFVWNNQLTGPIVIFPSLLSTQDIVDFNLLRPMSFFREPAAYALWICIFTIVMINEKKFILAAVATFSVLLSTSTEGLALSALIWGIWLLTGKFNFWLKVLVGFALFIAVTNVMTSDLFSLTISKASETDYSESNRLVDSFRLLQRLDLEGWLIGIGTTNGPIYEAYASSKGVYFEDLFLSSAAGVFVSYGLFVGILYWMFILKVITFKAKSMIAFSVCILVLPFVQTIFISESFIYVFSIYNLMNTHNKKCAISKCLAKETRA